MLGGPLVMAILLLGGEPERDIFAAHLALEFNPPLEIFASSPADGAQQRLNALDRIGKLVLSYEAGAGYGDGSQLPEVWEADHVDL